MDTPVPEATVTQSPLNLPQGEWVELTPMLSWVTEISGAVLDGKFYVTGGFDNTPVSSRAAQVYDIQIDTWAYVKRLPKPRNHAATASHEGKIYVFGGAGLYTSSADKGLSWVYDPITDDWSSITSMPIARYASAAITLNEYIYIVGGLVNDPEHEDVSIKDAALRYHPETDEWVILASAHETREHAGAVVLKHRIFMIGGRFGGLIDSVEIYDPINDTWTLGTPMNEGQAAHAAIVLDGRIYVCGGEDLEGGRTLDTVQIYDPEKDLWTYGPAMPYAVHGLTGFSFSDVIYLVGGSDQYAEADNHGRVLALRP
jgi:N-acetylneuraminic acid mutarotase